MAVLTNLIIILKNGVIIEKSVAGNVSVKFFVKFRSVVFEILMKMCFDFSISKAHSSEAKPESIFFFFARATPIIFGSSVPLRSLMQLFCNTLYSKICKKISQFDNLYYFFVPHTSKITYIAVKNQSCILVSLY